MRTGNTPGVPRFIGSGSGIHFIRTVYDALARSARGRHYRGWPGNLVPGEDDQLVEHTPGDTATPKTNVHTPFWRHNEIILEGESGYFEYDFETLVDWTKSYFQNWHPALPFLHGPEALDLLEQVASHGPAGLSRADVAMVRAMLSISLADDRQIARGVSPIPSNLVFYNLEDIASSLVFILDSPASLKNIKAAVCVELFLVSMLKFNMASRLSGVIVRMAFHLGLHRCPCRFTNFSPQEASIRKRVWWSLYCLERLLSQYLGLPLGIRDDDADVCLPGQELHKMATSGEDPEPIHRESATLVNLDEANRRASNSLTLSSRSTTAASASVGACTHSGHDYGTEE